MNYPRNYSILLLATIGLSSCTSESPSYNLQSYQLTTYDNSQLYPNMNYGMTSYGYQAQNDANTPEVQVPNSYHVGEFHSPVSFKDRDRNWVSKQNPQSYTIELADGEKPAQVAKKLYQAPKSDRMAQIKYQKEGKAHYKGLYGSYPNAEAAQKALESLPPEIKQGAGVMPWSNVQGNLE